MKKKLWNTGTGMIFLLGLSFTACSGTFTDAHDTLTAEGQEVSNDTSSVYCISSLPKEDLNGDEKAGILFMREEEKVARDVYTELFARYNTRVFGNISKSEQRHMDAVKALINRYELKDPAEGKDYGQFTNEKLQELYDKLISDAAAGEIEALRVGALIEEKDILDLVKELEENVDNQDITRVWNNLKKGSEAHLRAFVWNLKVRGVEYSPVLMGREEFDKIINRE